MPELLSQFSNLQQYHQHMMGLKGVNEFITSDRNPKAFNGPSAKWGAGAA
ncbi:hypothetical protein RvY_16443 [Ramazzottius varieornatus]|uniref:Uncharacterized protein n=1 Tax=Ramazzottius varieornatus TaxID=947166 RepID=A0A1D1W189_RAMVA|nr:hypothetical protein RvY_16443 [Ramazzottius varieornatus]